MLRQVSEDGLLVLSEARAVAGMARKGDEPKKIFVGSKTETALLRFAKENGWEDYARVRGAARPGGR